jgi:hypothetical protein
VEPNPFQVQSAPEPAPEPQARPVSAVAVVVAILGADALTILAWTAADVFLEQKEAQSEAFGRLAGSIVIFPMALAGAGMALRRKARSWLGEALLALAVLVAAGPPAGIVLARSLREKPPVFADVDQPLVVAGSGAGQRARHPVLGFSIALPSGFREADPSLVAQLRQAYGNKTRLHVDAYTDDAGRAVVVVVTDAIPRTGIAAFFKGVRDASTESGAEIAHDQARGNAIDSELGLFVHKDGLDAWTRILMVTRGESFVHPVTLQTVGFEKAEAVTVLDSFSR